MVQALKTEHPKKEVQVFFQDETRYGQKGGPQRVWAKRGSRPIRIKSIGFQCAYLFGAINPLSGKRVGLILTTVNTEAMNLFLQTLREEVPASVHIALVVDQAGWHRAKGLVIPSQMTLIPLPPYSPELNPIERLWKYLKESYFYHRVDKTIDEVIHTGVMAWQSLTEELIQSICRTSWLGSL